MKKLKILGLGRCIIGHLEKALNKDYSDKILFDHHYLLNYETCINSTFSQKESSKVSTLKCSPSISDQLFCLEKLTSYDICAIEVFPPAHLYIKDSIFACFEDFSDELKTAGFKPSNKKEAAYNEEYILIIEQLVNLVQKNNPEIKIILVNGEIASKENHIGSMRLYNLLNTVKTSNTFKSDKIQLLDMNFLIETLTSKKQSSFEISFPHIYIQHTSDLKFKAISRDTKHATPFTRKLFLKSFCEILKDFNFNAPQIEIDTPKLSYFDVSLNKRAKNYLSSNTTKEILLEDLKNSKKFSLYVTYAITTKDEFSIHVITQFMHKLSSISIREEELKLYFYHIRSICTFEISEKQNILSLLLGLANKITFLKEDELITSANFALLWIKNIYLVYSELYNKSIQKEIVIFQNNLNKNSFLLSFDEIKTILKNTKILTSQSI